MKIDMPTNNLKESLIIDEVIKSFVAKGLTDKFCVVPFSTLTLNPDGTVAACRQKGCDFVIGDLRKQSIEEIWNGEFFQKWRQEFLTGNPQICKKEIADKKCNLCPESSKILPHLSLKKKVETTILKLGANLNGQCNARCKICFIWSLPSGFYDTIDFWEKAPDNLFPFLKEIDLYAGEPFIQKDTYRLIDILSEINQSCLWTITTNLNWELTDFIKDKLDKVRIKNIVVSIDSLIPEVYESIRKGSNLNRALKTLDDLIEYNQNRLRRGLGNLNIRIHNVILKDNAMEIESLVNFANEKGLHSFRSFLYKPQEYSLLSLDKHEICSILDGYFESYDSNMLERSANIIRPLISSLPVKEQKKYYLKLMIGSTKDRS